MDRLRLLYGRYLLWRIKKLNKKYFDLKAQLREIQGIVEE